MAAEDDITPDGKVTPHFAVTANRLATAFNVWAMVVGGSAVLVITFLTVLATQISSFRDTYNSYTVVMERRVTQLEEHDKLSDDERRRNTAAIAQLNRDVDAVNRDLTEHRINGNKK